MAGRIGERAELPRLSGPVKARVGVLVMRSYLLAGNTAHYDGVIAAFEARGLRVIPAFASGLDARPAIEQFFMRRRRSRWSKRGLAHRLLAGRRPRLQRRHGRPRRCWPGWTCPTSPRTRSNSRRWTSGTTSDRGLHAGRGHDDGGASRSSTAPPARWSSAAARAQSVRRASMPSRTTCRSHPRARPCAGRDASPRPSTLRRTPRAERKVGRRALQLPAQCGQHRHGRLSLRCSNPCINTLTPPEGRGLHGRGARPTSTRCASGSSRATRRASARTPTSMRASRPTTMCAASAGSPRSRRNGARHRAGSRATAARSSCSASASATCSSACSPPSATRATRCGCCSSSGFAPTHAFSAFYRWLREDFGAHAVLHFGTHGALEFMPGKQAGLSAPCWPDRLIGDLPEHLSLRLEQPFRGHDRQAPRRRRR